MRGPLLVGAAALIGLTAALCYEQPSPGPLTSAHATTDASLPTCAVCHTEDGLDQGCLGCHGEIAAQLREERGLHHEVIGKGAPACARCHPEHHGATFDTMEAVAWQPDGRDAFRHGHVTFTLAEAHEKLGCEACHKTPFTRPGYEHKPRTHTFLGLSQACGTCHENVHRSAAMEDCARCHGQQVFKPALGFRHDDHFPLTGGHASVTCQACHGEGDDPTFKTVRGTTCAQCHENPHATSWTESCDACHRPDETSWSAARGAFTPARHAVTGFALVAPHRDLGCETCHAQAGTYAERFPSPARDLEHCDACHADVHAGQFVGRFGSCRTCHAETHFRPSTFDVARHDVFALRGAHVTTECNACHKDVAGRRTYVGTPTTCAMCHEDVHQGQFEASCQACHDEKAFKPSRYGAAQHTTFPLRGAHAATRCDACHRAVAGVTRYADTPTACSACHADVHAGQFTSICATCHDERAFRPSRYGISDHVTFPLRGAHDAVACSACHTPDAAGVRRFKDTPRNCASCHENPHGAQFDQGGARRDCATCHAPGASTFAIRPFDHGARTGYALVGKHVGARCNDCHRATRASAARVYRGTSTRCDACHTDQHRGQFTGRDCSACHASNDRWALSTFDHGRTRFPLDGRHVRVSCAKCHAPVKQRDGSLVVQYRPLGNRCEDCHEAGR